MKNNMKETFKDMVCAIVLVAAPIILFISWLLMLSKITTVLILLALFAVLFLIGQVLEPETSYRDLFRNNEED